jgi:hypothetical protein
VNMHILFSVHNVAQAVICVCCIQKVPAFGFGPETCHPDQSILQLQCLRVCHNCCHILMSLFATNKCIIWLSLVCAINVMFC